MVLQKVQTPVRFFIYVIDNACDHDVKSMVETMDQQHPDIPISYFAEEQKGIVFARNRCVEEFLKTEAHGLLFIDDDEWPADENWINKLYQAFVNFKSDIVTSNVISVASKTTPKWATELLYGTNRMQDGEIAPIFYTNNVLISRKVLDSIQPAFDVRFANTGASDYHFALKCRNSGYICHYTNAPVIEEFPESRAKVSWFIRRGYRSGIGFTRSHLFEFSPLRSIPECLLWSLIRLFRGFSLLLIYPFRLKSLFLVDGLFRIASAVGTIAGFFGLTYEEYKETHGQ